MSWSLAVDIGGTFTDAVLRADDGALIVDKTLTTHQNLLEGFFRAANLVLEKAHLTAADIDGVVVHATTVVTNALIERKGAPTALITTQGFADVLSIRNEHRYDMYDPQIEFADPLIPRNLTFEVDERTLADGQVILEVDAAQVRALAGELKAAGVVSVAICLINGFRNGANEQAIAAVLAAEAPDLYLSLSSSVAPQIREHPRASTTAINAYATPISAPYLDGLRQGLEARGAPNRPLIMLSSGGVIGAEVAARHPVRMIESGPAAGALAAAHYARSLGLDRLLSFDMGGTTAKACLIEDRKPLVTGLFEVDRKYRFAEGSGMPLTIPSIDMIEIGAGGGSIAWIDNLGLMKVGPRSAGSEPGPACYGRGGREATVTDADLVLGLLDADNFLGGDMPLDAAAAERAIDTLALALGASRPQAAAGVYRIVAEAMAGAARAHATDRGVDHRGLPLLAFGGAGPVHACAVGELLQSEAVIFPPQASVLSAFGSLVTPVRLDLVRSALRRLEDLDWEEVDRLTGEMTAEGLAALGEAGTAADDIRWSLGADLRYAGQQNEVGIVFAADPRPARDLDLIRRPFETAYFAQYGVNPSHVPVEVVSWRLTARGADRETGAAARLSGALGQPKGRRPIALWTGAEMATLFDRSALALGQVIEGPALIEERETTIVLPPRWSGTVDALGCITARRR